VNGARPRTSAAQLEAVNIIKTLGRVKGCQYKKTGS